MKIRIAALASVVLVSACASMNTTIPTKTSDGVLTNNAGMTL